MLTQPSRALVAGTPRMYIAGIGGSHVTKTPERLFRDDIRISFVAKGMESMEREDS